MVRQDTELTLGDAHVVFMYVILVNYSSSFKNFTCPSSLGNYDFI